MVTKLLSPGVEAVEVQPITLTELGASIGIPIKVRPWWGSAREPDRRVHTKCGTYMFPSLMIGRWRCWECGEDVKDEDTKRFRSRRRWHCPGGYNYAQNKPPEIQDGSVIIWEGKCGVKTNGRGHKHHQDVEVLSVEQGAMLLRITVSTNSSHFLIGVDDDHPYVTAVHKRPRTVQEAFDWLTPNIVRRAIDAGLEVRRQGDWHFIPTDREPNVRDSGMRLYYRSIAGEMVMGRARNGGWYENAPLIYGEETRHRGELVVYQSLPLGLAYPAPMVKGTITAPNHSPLHLPGWHIGVRNRSSNSGRRVVGGGD